MADVTNYGLLNNISGGIQAALTGYQTIQKNRRDDDLLQAQLKAQGLIKDDSGNLQYTPEKQTQIASDQKLSSLRSQRELESYDPNSQTSLKYRQGLQGAGITLPEDTDVNTAKGLLPAYEQKQKQSAQKDVSDERYQTMKDIAELKGSQAAAKKQEVSPKDWATFNDSLDASKARGGNLAKNQARVDSADRLNKLITDKNGELKDLDPRQQQELAIGIQSMLSPTGGGSVEQVKHLVPHTLMGDAKGVQEWLLNEPTGTNQKEFVKRMADTLQREKDVTTEQIKRDLGGRLAGHRNLFQSDPNYYRTIVTQGGRFQPEEINDQGLYSPAPKPQGLVGGQGAASHPQDAAAVGWANNPKSPGWSKAKADAILKANGL